MTITEQQFYDMLNVDEHMNFTNRIQELVFDKKGREEFYSKILNIHHDMGIDFFRDYFMAHSAVSAKGQHYIHQMNLVSSQRCLYVVLEVLI